MLMSSELHWNLNIIQYEARSSELPVKIILYKRITNGFRQEIKKKGIVSGQEGMQALLIECCFMYNVSIRLFRKYRLILVSTFYILTLFLWFFSSIWTLFYGKKTFRSKWDEQTAFKEFSASKLFNGKNAYMFRYHSLTDLNSLIQEETLY